MNYTKRNIIICVVSKLVPHLFLLGSDLLEIKIGIQIWNEKKCISHICICMVNVGFSALKELIAFNWFAFFPSTHNLVDCLGFIIFRT